MKVPSSPTPVCLEMLKFTFFFFSNAFLKSSANEVDGNCCAYLIMGGGVAFISINRCCFTINLHDYPSTSGMLGSVKKKYGENLSG